MTDLKHKDITEKIIGALFELHKFLGNDGGAFIVEMEKGSIFSITLQNQLD